MGKRKRVRVERRDSDDQADRYISRNLQNVPNLSSHRNTAGESVKQCIKKELKAKKICKGSPISQFFREALARIWLVESHVGCS